MDFLDLLLIPHIINAIRSTAKGTNPLVNTIQNNLRMEKTLKLADGPALLDSLEQLLLEKAEKLPDEMSEAEHHFLAERARIREEDDPFARMEQNQALITFIRANEREFR